MTGAAASRSCVCDDNTIEGGCCRQDRCRARPRKRAELLGGLRPCFVRVEPWLQAGKYAAALMSDLPKRNGWTLAERGDDTPDRMQRLLNRAVWDTFAAMAVVRAFAVAGLDEAARRGGRVAWRSGRSMRLGRSSRVIAPRVSSGTTWAVRGRWPTGSPRCTWRMCGRNTGHALIAARQWIPREQAADPGQAASHGAARGSGVPHQRAAGH